MVMEKNKRPSMNYTYGNVAYDIQPKMQPKIRQNKKTQNHINKQTKKAFEIKLKLVGAIALMAALTFITLSRAAAINSLTSNVRSIKSDITAMQKENSNLEVEIASAYNLKGIEDKALGELNMITPDNESIQYIQVEKLAVAETENYKNETRAGFDIRRLLGLGD